MKSHVGLNTIILAANSLNSRPAFKDKKKMKKKNAKKIWKVSKVMKALITNGKVSKYIEGQRSKTK